VFINPHIATIAVAMKNADLLSAKTMILERVAPLKKNLDNSSRQALNLPATSLAKSSLENKKTAKT